MNYNECTWKSRSKDKRKEAPFMKVLTRFGKIIAVLMFVIGVSLYLNKVMAGKPVKNVPRSFVATYTVTNVQNGAEPVVSEIQIHTVKSTGDYKFTSYDVKTGATRNLIAAGDSVYEIKADGIRYSGIAWTEEMREKMRSSQFLRSSPQFVREETVAGMRTFVLRGEGSGDWIEKYYAPETGGTALKTVMNTNNGGYRITEAINVQFRDVSDDEVALPNLPIVR